MVSSVGPAEGREGLGGRQALVVATLAALGASAVVFLVT